MNKKIVYGLLVVSLLLLGSIFLFVGNFSKHPVSPSCDSIEGECLTLEEYENRNISLFYFPTHSCLDEDTRCYLSPSSPN